MRTPVIAGNWKMFKKQAEAAALVEGLIPLVKDTRRRRDRCRAGFHLLAAVRRSIAGTQYQPLRPGLLLGGGRGLHRRNLAGDAR